MHLFFKRKKNAHITWWESAKSSAYNKWNVHFYQPVLKPTFFFKLMKCMYKRINVLIINLRGMCGFLRPKFVSKMNPSSAMKANWANVTIFPHPGKSLLNTYKQEMTAYMKFKCIKYKNDHIWETCNSPNQKFQKHNITAATNKHQSDRK